MQITIDNANVKFENGKVTIDLNPEQIAELTCPNMFKLSTLLPKDEFKIGDDVFIVLEQTSNGTRVISKKFVYKRTEFGDSSDWRVSPIRKRLNEEYFQKIVSIIGEENILIMNRDLTSLDGLDDYGVCTDKVSLLTADEYARYHKILGFNNSYPEGWWLITPASTPSNGYSRDVCYVNFYGVPKWDKCEGFNSVPKYLRPFLNLKSSITVSKNITK